MFDDQKLFNHESSPLVSVTAARGARDVPGSLLQGVSTGRLESDL